MGVYKYDKIEDKLIPIASNVTDINDETVSNTSTWSSNKFMNEVLGGNIGEKKLLFEGNINSTRTYTLVDNIENYDYILITTFAGGAMQTHIIDRNTWTSANPSGAVQINHGNGDSSYYVNFRLSGSNLTVVSINGMNAKSIIGYKLGQVTVHNTITNPSPGESYSTDEQLTGGTWIDGKPIYRKVFTGLNLSFASTTGDWAKLSTSLDLDYATLIKVDVYRGGYKVPTIVVSSLKPITYHSTNLAWSNCNILAVEYTKTTDA